MESHKGYYGLWLSENEWDKFWLSVLIELQNWGVKDILIACIDGLKGFPGAINAVFPRDSNSDLNRSHGAQLSQVFALEGIQGRHRRVKEIYQSVTEKEALQALSQFAEHWDDKYPQFSKSWRTHWHNLNTLFNYPSDIRKMIYTTNAI